MGANCADVPEWFGLQEAIAKLPIEPTLGKAKSLKIAANGELFKFVRTRAMVFLYK